MDIEGKIYIKRERGGRECRYTERGERGRRSESWERERARGGIVGE